MSQRTLTLYLINAGVDPANIVRPGADHHSITFVGTRAEFYVKVGDPHPPPWVSFFRNIGLDLTAVQVMSTSAVLVVPASRRLFAITFGFGRLLLQPGVADDRFGLRVTLNAVNHTQIRSVDRLTLDSPAPHSQIQASRAANIGDFGINIDQDLLRAVMGNPRDEALGKRLTGKDALRTTGPFTILDLPAILRRFLAESRKTEYRDHFPWVDNVQEVKSPTVREALDEILVDRLRSDDIDGIWLAVPERVDWQTIEGFAYSSAPSADRHADLHLRTFLSTFRDPAALTVDSLKHRRVYVISSENDATIEEWPAYQCLYAELTHAGAQYLLNSGMWYNVDATFRDRIERTFQRVPQRSVDLPTAQTNEAEPEYNRRAARMNGFALMDQRLIRYPDRNNPIEFCDLYTDTQELIHVKHYGGSSTLSHHFAQGVTSGTLFAQDPGFRRAVNARLPASHQIQRPANPLTRGAYTITYAIISGSAKPLNIPFFSKVTLSHATKVLNGLGYTTQLAKIAVV